MTRRVRFNTTTDDLDELHRVVAARRAGTKQVRVDAEALFRLLADHAELSNIVEEENL